MTTTPEIVNLADVVLEPRPAEHQPPAAVAARIAARVARLRPRLGLHHLGCSLVEVPPGKQGWPLHGHRQNDELFLILSGSGTLQRGSERLAVREGDLVPCPAGGPESAHALLATGDTPLRYLAFSSQRSPEICDYPDSGKIGVFDDGDAPAPPLHLMLREADGLDYWDGE